MDFSGYMSNTEAVGDDTEDGLEQDEGEDGYADFVMEIAVGTSGSERRAQTLSRYRCHAEAKDEDDKEYSDGSESHSMRHHTCPLERR